MSVDEQDSARQHQTHENNDLSAAVGEGRVREGAECCQRALCASLHHKSLLEEGQEPSEASIDGRELVDGGRVTPVLESSPVSVGRTSAGDYEAADQETDV